MVFNVISLEETNTLISEFFIVKYTENTFARLHEFL